MWIRSQNKKFLMHCTYFTVEVVREPFMIVDVEDKERRDHIGDYAVKSGGQFLGYYLTKQRAQKVLDIIEKSIGLGLNEVFHMPSDEEAKIFEDL